MTRHAEGKRGWALLGVGLVVLGVVLVSVFAGGEEVGFTATPYAEMVRFAAKAPVVTLQVQIHDLSGGEVWDSGVVAGFTVDWDRANQWGERLAYGVYLYQAQGWDAQGKLVLERSGKLALLPGDRVQLQAAPAVSTSGRGEDSLPSGEGSPTVGPMGLGDVGIFGQVGIGTLSPIATLEVAKDTDFQMRLQRAAVTLGPLAGLNMGNARFMMGVDSNQNAALELHRGTTGFNQGWGVYIDFAYVDNADYNARFLMSSANLLQLTGNASFAYTGAGNVGIGTLTPANRLDVSNPGGFQLGLTDPLGPDHWDLDAWSWGLDFWDTFGNNPVGFEVGAPDSTLYVAANGGVGIGTNWNWPRGGLEIQCGIGGDPNDTELYLTEPTVGDWNQIWFDCSFTDWLVAVDDGFPGLFLIGDLNAPGWGMDLWYNGAWYDMWVYGDIYATGTKFFAEKDPTDPTKVIVYSTLEGPEAGTYVRGSAELVGGEAVIFLPDHFAKVTVDEGLTVVLTPVGEWRQLYVVEKSTSHIVVREATGQDGTFDYLVQGIRTGHEDYQVVRDRAELPVMEAGERGAPRWPEFLNLDVPQGGGKEERTPPTE